MDRIIEQHDVDKVVVAITERRGEYPVKEMLALRVGGYQVLEWPGFFEKLSGRIPIDSLAPSFFIFNEGFRKSRILLSIRRVVSAIVAAVFLVLLLPVFLVVAVLIKLDSPGPVLYSQIRVGQTRQADPDLQIPFDAERRGKERGCGMGGGERPPDHEGRTLPPENADRRTAATVQRHDRGTGIRGSPSGAS